MKSKNNKIAKIIVMILGGCMVIAHALVIIATVLSSQHTYRYRDYVDFRQGWITDTGEPADLSELEDYAYVYKVIPELEVDSILFFHAKSINVAVYIGDEKLYETENYNENIFGHTPGSYFVKVRIKESYAGQELKIIPDTPYHDGSGKIKQMYLGDGIDILRDMVCDKLVGFLLNFLIVVLGFALVVLYIPMRSMKLAPKDMLYLGLFAYNVGVYLLFDGWVFSLLLGHESLFHMVAELWLMLIAVPLVLYLNSQYHVERKMALAVLCGISLTVFFFCVLIHTLNIKDYHEIIITTHISFVIIIVYFLWLTAYELIKGKMKEKHHVLGLSCIFAGALMDIIFWKLGTASEGSMFTRVGMLLFLAFEGGQIILDMMASYKNTYKSELLSRLAYHDGLTDLLNRTSYKEDLARLEQTRECRLAAVFDVNDLKVMNDTFGHAKGDELIVTVAAEIQKAFSDVGSCYRIGGDEFVFLSNAQCTEDSFSEHLARLWDSVKEISKQREYSIKIACGYSLWEEQESLKQVIDEADNRMYEEKKRMKTEAHEA
ncbi:MAG: diguanylate cyclase [Lachnospiraceae bacterium]|nr:diguanylate cyclase [Lachnospiraceae bacterium]